MIIHLFLLRLRLAFVQSDGKSLSASTRAATTDSSRSNHVQSANSSIQIPQAFAQPSPEHPDGRPSCRIRPAEDGDQAETASGARRTEVQT